MVSRAATSVHVKCWPARFASLELKLEVLDRPARLPGSESEVYRV